MTLHHAKCTEGKTLQYRCLQLQGGWMDSVCYSVAVERCRCKLTTVTTMQLYSGSSTALYSGSSTALYSGSSTALYSGSSTVLYSGSSTTLYSCSSTTLYSGHSSVVVPDVALGFITILFTFKLFKLLLNPSIRYYLVDKMRHLSNP